MRSCCASCVTTHAHNRGNVQGQSHRSAGTANSEENPGTLCALVTNCIYLASKQLSSEHAQTHAHIPSRMPSGDSAPSTGVLDVLVDWEISWPGQWPSSSGGPPKPGTAGGERAHASSCLPVSANVPNRCLPGCERVTPRALS